MAEVLKEERYIALDRTDCHRTTTKIHSLVTTIQVLLPFLRLRVGACTPSHEIFLCHIFGDLTRGSIDGLSRIEQEKECLIVAEVLKARIDLSDTESGTFIDPERLSESSLRRRNPTG